MKIVLQITFNRKRIYYNHESIKSDIYITRTLIYIYKTMKI